MIKMIVKVYEMMWAFIASLAGILFLTGNFTNLTAVVFGFVSFGMVFMGMMGVLPATISQRNHGNIKDKKVPAKKAEEKESFHVGAGHVHAH